MGIRFQEIFIDYEAFVQFIRPNRGRSTRSPFPLFAARTLYRGNKEVLHLSFVGMTGHATGIHSEQGTSGNQKKSERTGKNPKLSYYHDSIIGRNGLFVKIF